MLMSKYHRAVIAAFDGEDKAIKGTQIMSAVQSTPMTRKRRSSGSERRKRERGRGNSNEDLGKAMADP